MGAAPSACGPPPAARAAAADCGRASGPADARARQVLALQRSAEAAYDDVCQQLAFRLADDQVSFDFVALAYSLVTWVSIGSAVAHESARPRDAGDRDAVGSSSALPPANPGLVAAALSALFGAQGKAGTWDKGQPIFLFSCKNLKSK